MNSEVLRKILVAGVEIARLQRLYPPPCPKASQSGGEPREGALRAEPQQNSTTEQS